MTLTESELAFDLNLLLDGAEGDPEIECVVDDCKNVALWQLIMERPCKHAPYYYCDSHAEWTKRKSQGALVRFWGWRCELCPLVMLGQILRIEPIKRG